MGAVQSNHISGGIFFEHSSEIQQSDFNIIPNYSYTQHLDPYYSSNFTVLSHKQKHQLELQKYQLFFNTYEQYQTYEEIFNWRNKSKFLVQAKAIKQKPSNRFCGTFHQATLFLERIPIRACEITDIPIQEGLYLLYTCFLGFRKIYEKTGYFDISLDMICINKDALVKVWLNTNLSKIYPQLYSINQNLREGDLINKILFICEPLIDFEPVHQKFSDFLKGCYFNASETPKKQDNKFCQYSKVKEHSNQNSFKKSNSFSNLNLLTFDKIIEYFQGYLNKHNLVIAREMKSIKDLFKIQPKIQFNSENSTFDKKTKFINENPKKEEIQPLKFLKNEIKVKNRTRRKESKRTNNALFTDRSKSENVQALFSYKSQEYMKNIKQFKEPALLIKRPPSISFNNYPPIKIDHQQLLSPQHVSAKKRFYFQEGRQRIKTSVVPHISFSLKNPLNQKSQLVTQNSNQELTERYFKKSVKQNNFFSGELVGNRINENVINHQSLKSIKIRNQQIPFDNYNNPVKVNNQMSLEKEQQLKMKIQFQKNPTQQKKRKVCYALKSQWSIDQDIAKDLDMLQNLSSNQN